MKGIRQSNRKMYVQGHIIILITIQQETLAAIMLSNSGTRLMKILVKKGLVN